MKISWTQIFGLVVALGQIAPSANPQSPPDASPASSTQNPPKRSSKFQDIVAHADQFGNIPCNFVLPNDKKLECTDKIQISFRSYLDMYQGLTKKRGAGYLKVEVNLKQIKDPIYIEREIAALGLQKSLDPIYVQQVEFVERGEDYLVVVQDAPGPYSMSLHDYRQYYADPELQKPDRNINHIFLCVEHVRNRGVVALSFDVVTQMGSDCYKCLKIGGFRCSVKQGEPVGKCSFDPLYSDPELLKGDPTLKADPAMDLYTLGIHLVHMLETNQHESIEQINQKVLRMKEKGEFTFGSGTELSLVLFAAFLLQKDRQARQDKRLLEQITEMVQREKQAYSLIAPLTYSTKTNPLEVPELQPLVKELVLPEPNVETVAQPGSSGWVWYAVGGAGAVALAVVVYFVFRPKDPSAEETKKELQGVEHGQTEAGIEPPI